MDATLKLIAFLKSIDKTDKQTEDITDSEEEQNGPEGEAHSHEQKDAPGQEQGGHEDAPGQEQGGHEDAPI